MNDLADKPLSFIKTALEKRKNEKEIFYTVLSEANNHFKIIYDCQAIDEAFMPVILATEGLSNFVPIRINPDGNCFYYAISMFLFGNSDYFKVIRIGILFMLFDIEDKISEILVRRGYNKTIANIAYDLIKDRAWASDIIIGILSLLLKRPIYNYSINDFKKSMNFIFILDREYENNEPVTIALYNYHFVPLLRKQNNINAPVPLVRFF